MEEAITLVRKRRDHPYMAHLSDRVIFVFSGRRLWHVYAEATSRVNLLERC